MPLARIKLAGFKSFVDPTLIPFQANLTAIVGPNGCGKSNIIDAVRWVLGEKSAKELRGESMSDVIFNGSSTRKPMGQAAVELVFDNSAAMIGGEYARYNEISIRREVGRDGISNYYLNNVSCRRKDIIDPFLGTGLRYSIIEQGTILQLIDAKPDELRLHIEEAAQVSKYRERRRETENRISHTKDNLARLADIRHEIENQLKALKKQSNIAVAYKALRDEERLVKAKLISLSWHHVDVKIKEIDSKLKNEEIILQEKIAILRKIESNLEISRQKKISVKNDFEEVQSNFYKLGVVITELEQRIRYNKERQRQLQHDLSQLEKIWNETQQHKIFDSERIKILQDEILKLNAESFAAGEKVKAAHENLVASEKKFNSWHIFWEEFNANATSLAQRIATEEARLKHLKDLIFQKTKLIAQLEVDIGGLIFTDLIDEISSLSEEKIKIEAKENDFKANLSLLQERIVVKRENISILNENLNKSHGILRELQGKKSALLALQKNALGGSEKQVFEWISNNDFENKLRLAQDLVVDPEWEKAVEVVLGDYVEAIYCDGCHDLLAKIPSLQNVCGNEITFLFDINAKAYQADYNDKNKATLLSSKIKFRSEKDGFSGMNIPDFLLHVYVASDLCEALKIRESLSPYESVVTKDGVLFGTSWVRVALKEGSKSGVLNREQELRKINKEISLRQENIEELSFAQKNKNMELLELENNLRQLQHDFQNNADYKWKLNGILSSKQAELDHLRKHSENLNQNINSQKESLDKALKQLIAFEDGCGLANNEKEENEKKRVILLQERDQLRNQLEKERAFASQCKDIFDSCEMKMGLVNKEIEYLNSSLLRSEKQLESVSARKVQLEASLREVTLPMQEIITELDAKLNIRLALDKELNKQRLAMDEVDEIVRELETTRDVKQREITALREIDANLRVEKEGLSVKSINYLNQINELNFTHDEIISRALSLLMDGKIDEQSLVEKQERILKRIERLGPINLAAIDEFNKQKERKDYLDAQNDDLLSALGTLENAIAKIDSETRSKIKSTFDVVNSNLQQLFPKIFGGGSASLEWTDEADVLNAGVMIWAKPPGKCNSSIHLLSGGEKALTAVALIFSIFQLNPAPFCLLDEVDAPFDDENIGRFSRLLQEMSSQIQFIYISHNKLSIQVASQLMGVTMQEPGVSRVVTVDIDRAIEMVD